MGTPRRTLRGLTAVLLATAMIGAALVAAPSPAHAGPSIVTQTFGYTGSTTTFTVPTGITQLTLSMLGAEGGRGGADASGPSPAGGYQGAISGTMAVTPGQVLTIAVGKGGATGANDATGSTNPADYTNGAAVGGVNPLGSFAGGNGGVAGYQGDSGDGGAGGAATVISTGSINLVAGGAGGAGGSGQFPPTLGRVDASTFTARTDTVSANGQLGITVANVCTEPGSVSCDGGGSGGGGGGVTGGAQGQIQFGSGSSDEWYGYGGSPGENSTGDVDGLSASYQYYSDDAANGSVTISYATGAPGAPTAVSGVAGDTSVGLVWTAPASTGGSPITNYVVQYAPASSPTSWTTFDSGSSMATSATVTGLADGTAYVFQVAAVNSFGQGDFSAASGSVTPTGPPAAPDITSVSPQDGGLSVAFTPAASGSPVVDYEYQLDDSGAWVSSGSTTSPLAITGLVNGTPYTVAIRAVSGVGDGTASADADGTPAAPPGAPTITSVSTGVGSASAAFTPGYLGGLPVTDYQYQLDGGTWTSAGTTSSPLAITGLADGTTYTVAIRAVTASGAGAQSQAASVTTPDLPGAPTVTSVAPGDGSLSIAFNPGDTGGATITSYQYQLASGGPWATAPSLSSPIVVTGLTDGTTYPVSVRAVNAVGAGPGSTPQPATPATVPGAPTIVGDTVAGSNSQLDAAFTPPAFDGGSPIADYEYSTDGGATWQVRATGTTASPVVISTLSSDGSTPLVDGTTYFVELRAVNAVGSGVASDVATGIAQTTPSAPTISTVSPGPSSLQVSFQPASNGGAAITDYQYRLDGGSWVDTGTLGDTFLINGLTNGTSYAVSLRAVNAQGDSAASAAVSGTPVTTPDQPTITGVVRADQSLTIAVNEDSDGGSPLTDWQYSTDGGATWASAAVAGGPLTVTTLSTDGVTPIVNGTSYPIAVRAVNAEGVSAASATTTVGPSATPDAPAVQLTATDQAIQVAFTVASDGGSPVSAIEYRLDGGAWVNAGTLSSPFTIGSLANGTDYTVEVRADNAIGVGTASAPAASTPFTVPDAPSSVVAVSDSAAADTSWTAPDSDGGAPISDYIAAAFATPTSTTPVGTCTTAGTSCSITGLTNGTSYYVSVVADNAAGASVASAPMVPVIPLARPSAPTLTSLTAGNALLTLVYTAGSAGSMPITGYDYQLNGGAWLPAGSTSSPLTISGLTNGTSYTVSLRADSAAGVGVASSTLTATPFTFPDAPDPLSVAANAGSGSVVVSWAAPTNDGGSPITSYTATAFNDPLAGSQVQSCSTTGALTCTITGLTNGTTYYIALQAGNAAGLSARTTPRVAATPSIDPGAVSAVAGVAGDGQVSLSWAGGSTGASPINNYTVWYSSGGAYTQFVRSASTATSATVTGLTNGTAYTFEVAAVNSNGTGPASTPSGPVIPLPPNITSPALGGGEINAPYDSLPTAWGTGPFIWSVTGGTLPSGLQLNTSSGEISGTPTLAGVTSAFTLVATDALGNAATQAESITVTGPPVITTPPLTDGEVGVAYDAVPTLAEGVGPFIWSVTGGSLPDGLQLDPISGEISGTPTTGGTSAFNLVVTDTDGHVGTQPESVTVASGPSVASPALGGGEVGVPYDALPTTSGGTGPFTWSVTGGTLPDGLQLDPITGEISGDPTTGATSAFDLVATDSLDQTASQAESITVALTPTVDSAALGAGEIGVAYDAVPTISGGTGPFTWAVTGGVLPAGLQLDPATGEVAGTPTAAGTSTFSLVATDADGQSGAQFESITVAGTPIITSGVLGGGETGVAYDTAPTTSDGTGPFAWGVTGGSLPAGLQLDPVTGEISGTPTTPGTSTFTLVATDADGQAATQAESVTIAATPGVDGDGIGAGEVGVPYDAAPTVSDGTGPFTWSVNGGSLPDGLLLDPATGEITGTPTTAGTWTFTLVATDADQQTSGRAGSITIAADPTVTGPTTVAGQVGVALDDQLGVEGGTGPSTWSVTADSLPAGVILSPSGSVEGTPTTAGTYRCSITATDANGRSSTEVLTITVAPTGLNSRLIAVTPDAHGYWITSSNGQVLAFGSAQTYGTLAGTTLSAPIVGMAATPDGKGYWLVAADGGVFAFGDAGFYGSTGAVRLNRPIVGMTATPDGHGYWLVAADGGVFAFGDAGFHGSTGAVRLNRPIVGMAATPDGHGYWLVAADGGVFAFGDAGFTGSTGAVRLNRPVVGMAATPDGHGYWLVASDGGIFAFGDARFYGSMGGTHLNAPVDGIQSTPSGDGYWMVASDGGVFAFGDAGFIGSAPGDRTPFNGF